MTFTVATVHEFSAYDRRRELAVTVDNYQDRVISSIERGGFSIDWEKIAAELLRDRPSSSLEVIERMIRAQLRDRSFLETDAALVLNGEMIARYAQRQDDRNLKGRAPELNFHEFAGEEAKLFVPEEAMKYWRSILKLTDEQIAALLHNLNTLHSASFAMAGRVSTATMNRLATIFAETIAKGFPFEEFVKQIRDVMPDAAKHILDTEYRTRLTQSYGGSRFKQVQERKNAFPFLQFMALKDGRTTWWICLPMGKAGPNGRGFIAATDDPIWIAWRPPNHFGCRSDISPIPFLEAQRMGILARDGKTRIALIGSNPSRPYGDPPKFATDEVSRKIRRVEPQIGFGA